MKGVKILVTGGLGFIGSHTVVTLLENGLQPVIIDNLENTRIEVLNGIERICGVKPIFEKVDLRDESALNDFLDRHELSGVIHFAAYKSVYESMSNPLKYHRNNVGALICLLEALRRRKVENFIFSSSCSVYGQADHMPITEEAPIKKAWSPYAYTKQIGEEILRQTSTSDKSDRLRVISLRYFNPIGAHPSGQIGELPFGVPNNLIPFIVQTAAGIRKELQIFGNDYPTPDGTCIRDYLHVMDLAKAHLVAIQRLLSRENESKYEIYNIGTGVGHSVLAIVKTFEATVEKKLNYVFAPRRAGDVISVYADPALAYKKMGWKTEKSLEESLRDAWYWQEKLSDKKL